MKSAEHADAPVTGEASQPVNPGGPPASKQAQEVPDRHVDAELVNRVRSGDQAAFRALFDKYHRRAYAVAFGVVKNEQDALDVVQEAFIKVHRHIDNFQGTSSFYTWLYRIVMNLAIDQLRKARKTTDFDDRIGHDDAAGDGALLPHIMDGNPAKTVARRELVEKIQGALAQLPEYHRAVILLRELEGMSYEELSQVLEVPKGTIMSRLFHARKKVQEILKDYVDGDLDIGE